MILTQPDDSTTSITTSQLYITITYFLKVSISQQLRHALQKINEPFASWVNDVQQFDADSRTVNRLLYSKNVLNAFKNCDGKRISLIFLFLDAFWAVSILFQLTETCEKFGFRNKKTWPNIWLKIEVNHSLSLFITNLATTL